MKIEVKEKCANNIEGKIMAVFKQQFISKAKYYKKNIKFNTFNRQTRNDLLGQSKNQRNFSVSLKHLCNS